jgi:hypothetical protein
MICPDLTRKTLHGRQKCNMEILSVSLQIIDKKFWHEVIAHFSLIRKDRKKTLPTILCRGNMFTERLSSNGR